MPVSDDHALRQFEIEALRQITDNLKRLNDRSEEQGRTLHSIDNRLIRIESNSVNSDVAALKEKVDGLERERDRREGALGLTNWLLRNWLSLAGIVVVIAVVLKANGKL